MAGERKVPRLFAITQRIMETVKKNSRFETDDSNKIGLKGYNEGNDENCMCYNTS